MTSRGATSSEQAMRLGKDIDGNLVYLGHQPLQPGSDPAEAARNTPRASMGSAG